MYIYYFSLQKQAFWVNVFFNNSGNKSAVSYWILQNCNGVYDISCLIRSFRVFQTILANENDSNNKLLLFRLLMF